MTGSRLGASVFGGAGGGGGRINICRGGNDIFFFIRPRNKPFNKPFSFFLFILFI
jgi:hypothetical protein